MCSHYQLIKARERLQRKFGIVLPPLWEPPPRGLHIFKGYEAPFIISPGGPEFGETGERECLQGVFGLIPHYEKSRTIKYSTLNARAETAAALPSYRTPWRRQHCVVPADWVYEPDWRSGRAVNTRVKRADGEPMGLAGLWDMWEDPASGESLFSFALMTVNADDHALMRHLQQPDDEKRMVVVLPEDRYDAWLSARPEESMGFMRQYPAELLAVEADPLPSQVGRVIQ